MRAPDTPHDGTGSELEKVDLLDLAPPEWGLPARAAWISVARVFKLGASELQALREQQTLIFDVGNVRAVMFLGTPPRKVLTSHLEVLPWTGGPVELYTEISSPPDRTLAQGVWLILLTPEEATATNPENDAFTRLDNALSVIRLFAGRNAAYDEPFARTRIENNTYSASSPSILQPAALPNAEYGADTLQTIGEVANLLESETAEAERVRLALRWAKRGEELSGPDAVLSWWIAIETVAMPDTTNIRPLVEVLARIGDIDHAAAQERYRIGHLFDLRGRIVHQGRADAVHAGLLDYLRAILVDVIGDLVGRPVGAVEQLLGSDDFDLDGLIRHGMS